MLNGLLLVALALQYGTQPYLTSRFISSLAVDSRAVILVTELLKAALCAFPVLLRATPAGLAGSGAFAPVRTRRSTLSSLRRASLPAVCYLLQNLALQAAYRDLDSLTFNCLNQTKVVATAVTLYLLTRQGQSPQQCLALLLVVCAGILLQLAGEAQLRETSGSEGVAAFRRGVVMCLFASALSGLASSLSQVILQAFLTVPVIAVNFVWSEGSVDQALARAAVGWTPIAFIPIMTQALGGIVVGLITKRMGGISKGFAVVGGLTVTGAMQSIQAGKAMSAELWAAWAMVVCSTWLHTRYPWQRKRKAD